MNREKELRRKLDEQRAAEEKEAQARKSRSSGYTAHGDGKPFVDLVTVDFSDGTHTVCFDLKAFREGNGRLVGIPELFRVFYRDVQFPAFFNPADPVMSMCLIMNACAFMAKEDITGDLIQLLVGKMLVLNGYSCAEGQPYVTSVTVRNGLDGNETTGTFDLENNKLLLERFVERSKEQLAKRAGNPQNNIRMVENSGITHNLVLANDAKEHAMTQDVADSIADVLARVGIETPLMEEVTPDGFRVRTITPVPKSIIHRGRYSVILFTGDGDLQVGTADELTEESAKHFATDTSIFHTLNLLGVGNGRGYNNIFGVGLMNADTGEIIQSFDVAEDGSVTEGTECLKRRNLHSPALEDYSRQVKASMRFK